MKKTKKKILSKTSSDGYFTVIKLFENDTTLFDCIPDIWFTDENQDFCYWPPTKGKSVAIRALKQEIPDESWEQYHCEVVKGGFVTYSCGCALVREKCLQKYNTSSAEEHISAAKFRRQHPGLSLGVSLSFDDVFTKKSTKSTENNREKARVIDEPSKNDAVIELKQSTHSESQIPSPSEEILPRHNSPTPLTSCKTVCIMASSQDVNGSSKRLRIRSTSRQSYSIKGSYSSQSKQGSRKISQARSRSTNSTEKGKNVGSLPGKHQRCSAIVNLPSTTPRGQGLSTSHRNKTANINRVDRRSDSQKSKRSSASSSCSSKSQRSRSSSSRLSSYQKKIANSDRVDRQSDSQKSKRSSASSSCSSKRQRSRSSSSRLSSYQKKIANSDRVDRRSDSQKSKRSSASSSCSSKSQRSRSSSSRLSSYQKKIANSDRVDRQSDSQKSKRSSASSSCSSKRQRSRSSSSRLNSHQKKIANSDRGDRRSDSQKSKRSSASSSCSSKRQRSRSSSSRLNSYQKKIANSDRVDRRKGSQKSKGSSASSSCSSKRQRSRSSSSRLSSYQKKFAKSDRVDRRSGSQNSKGSASSSCSSKHQRSRSSSSRLNSHQKKIANSDRVDRRKGSQKSKGSSASSSYSSKRQRSHSFYRQSNSSNGTSYSSKSDHSLKKLVQAKYVSKNSQHPSASIDKDRSSSKNMLNSSCQSQMLIREVRELTKAVFKNHHENDRRLTRMEVSINKILVRLGDITRSNTAQSQAVPREYSNEDLRYKDAQNNGASSRRQRHEDAQIYGESRRHQQSEIAQIHGGSSRRRQRNEGAQNHSGSSRRFVNPKDQRSLPITSLNELVEANQQLMNRSFFAFLVNQEKEFCMPGKNTSVNVVITTYLKRFIILRVRSLLTLKELQSDDGMTLFADFYYVYLFLIEVIREGYNACNRSLTEKDANESLRIVWGRTKQLLNDEQKKKK